MHHVRIVSSLHVLQIRSEAFLHGKISPTLAMIAVDGHRYTRSSVGFCKLFAAVLHISFVLFFILTSVWVWPSMATAMERFAAAHLCNLFWGHIMIYVGLLFSKINSNDFRQPWVKIAKWTSSGWARPSTWTVELWVFFRVSLGVFTWLSKQSPSRTSFITVSLAKCPPLLSRPETLRA